jgi:glucose-1-phosphate cytidylyltransferase
VALFCGGLGTRLRDFSQEIPKPLVPLGTMPIVQHVMKYYAHYGHRDFVLCLGYKADMIKDYFLNCPERVTRDVVLEHGAPSIRLAMEEGDWRVTFADTGLTAKVGERLRAVEPFFRDETIFLANYADGLSDFPLPRLIDEFKARGAVGMFLSVRPNCTFHFVRRAADGCVLSVDDVVRADAWINGGYFVFSNEIFRYMRPGEELVEEPFYRLIEARKLFAIEYDGFWRCIDTFKDLQAVENLLNGGDAPWLVWRRPEAGVAAMASGRAAS